MKALIYPLLALAMLGSCKKEEAEPPAPVMRTVRYEAAITGGNGSIHYRNASGEMVIQSNWNGPWHKDISVPPGTALTLGVYYPSSGQGRIIVDGDTIMEKINGGTIYLDTIAP